MSKSGVHGSTTGRLGELEWEPREDQIRLPLAVRSDEQAAAASEVFLSTDDDLILFRAKASTSLGMKTTKDEPWMQDEPRMCPYR
jgi:hypothetical protein